MQLSNNSKNRKSGLILALVCVFLHIGIAPNISLGKGVANFALIYAFCTTTFMEGKKVFWACFLAGLFFDLTTTGPVGLMSFELVCLAFLATSEDRAHMGEDYATIIKAFCLDCVVVTFVYGIAMLIVGDAHSFIDTIFFKTLPSCILTIIFFLPFMYVLNHSKSFGPSFSNKKRSYDMKKKPHHLPKRF